MYICSILKIMYYNLFFPNYNFAHKFDERPTKNDEFEDHFHMICEILLFIRGDAEFIIENKKFELKPGDLLFISPGQHHNINVNPEAPYERYVIKFPEYDIPKNILHLIKNKSGCFSTDNTSIPELFTRFDGHAEGYKGPDLCGLLKCALREILYYSCSGSKAYEPEVYNENMIEIINYIHENIAKGITLDEISERFHYSKSCICKEFQQCMNVPIMQYVRTKKILLANSLIKAGEKPMGIFTQCGFSDYSTFFRAYKKILGVAPSAKKQP